MLRRYQGGEADGSKAGIVHRWRELARKELAGAVTEHPAPVTAASGLE